MKVSIVGRRVVNPYQSKDGMQKPGGMELHYIGQSDRVEGMTTATQWVKAGTELFNRLCGPMPLPVDADMVFDAVPGRGYLVLSDVKLLVK